MERTLGHYHPDRAGILNIIVIVYRCPYCVSCTITTTTAGGDVY